MVTTLENNPRVNFGDDPESVETLIGLGTLCFQEQEFDKAVLFFEAAIETFRNRREGTPAEHLDALGRLNLCLGMASRAAGDIENALEALVIAAELAPNLSDAHLALGQVYHLLERPAHAIIEFKKLTELLPNDASAWLTLGFLQLDHATLDEAIFSLDRAVLLDSQSPEVHYLRGEALRRRQKHDEAVTAYQHLLPVAFEYPHGIVGLAKSLVALGRLDEGWDAFEFRRVSQLGPWETRTLQQWDGKPDQSTTLLVHSEDSIGSDIMFASCLSSITPKVGSCVVECDSSLHNLLARSFPDVSFIPISGETISEETQLADPKTGRIVDAQISLGSTPRFSRKRVTDFPIKRSYLTPSPDWLGVWRERLALLGSSLKVGILWQGAWTPETEQQRSIPFEGVCSLLQRHQDVRWISLQGGSAAKLAGRSRLAGVELKTYADTFPNDLDVLAALLASLDLVITPPGYVAHLAGAVGAETWLVVPEQSDWRWDVARGIGEGRSVWHRSMTLFRQQHKESWESVLGRLHVALTQFRAPTLAQSQTADEVANGTADDPQIFSLEAFRQTRSPAPSRRAA
ncbi:MAG: tetratricopeptide repeat protein [Thermoguttaceae bacterium]